MNMSQEEMIKLYREAVPESSYEECDGCHHGKKRCAAVHRLYSRCPCTGCLVKTSCTDYCEEFLLKLRWSVAGTKKINIVEESHKGYTVMIKYHGQRLHIKNTLRRWIEI